MAANRFYVKGKSSNGVGCPLQCLITLGGSMEIFTPKRSSSAGNPLGNRHGKSPMLPDDLPIFAMALLNISTIFFRQPKIPWFASIIAIFPFSQRHGHIWRTMAPGLAIAGDLVRLLVLVLLGRFLWSWTKHPILDHLAGGNLSSNNFMGAFTEKKVSNLMQFERYYNHSISINDVNTGTADGPFPISSSSNAHHIYICVYIYIICI